MSDLFTGRDATTGTEYLLTVWPDQTRELATRELGEPSWSAPVALEPVREVCS